MSSPDATTDTTTIPLGDIEPARSRHAGRRSAVALTDELIVVGTAAGDVGAYERSSLDERWTAEGTNDETSVVAATPFAGGVAVGERGPAGEIRLHDAATGRTRWRYVTADDVGEPQKRSRFFLPFVVDVETSGDRLYVAARRYERDGDDRSFRSVVYAFGTDGDVAWTYETDASPIGLDVDGTERSDGRRAAGDEPNGRVAVAYNRCPGDHQHGVVVLDAETGTVQWQWDPGTAGQRRVGDVSLLETGVAVASHGDYRGYRLGAGGAERWVVDLATPTKVDGETLYAYPNHVHATAEGCVFVTGNTYPEEGRETASLHPGEHTAFGYSPDGECAWSASVGGFAGEIAASGDRVAVPCAQQFRTRDPATHGLHVFDVQEGRRVEHDAEGIVTTVAVDERSLAAIEEPVVYHDEGQRRGAYRLHAGGL
ncbi:outer membrane protein assembly factor BamB family protein [Halococcus saccharolyticus]|uniref:Tup1 like transcriptional repressor n=1 Tax=Halococcus saccharolyticus DSM 5350 TaxID=1227455 RepID=M0MK96_9EURY|nr:PQQ-binding-like beta-propeller repeat protein [Halococcus saccharolyticus]EMA44870.1 Tup1 like transcriptional repressor [Halococcus saccharolyticus DSM 5350]